jgi:hypothetical protein
MFYVTFFVDDKKLAQTLINVSGVARDLKAVPAVNVAKKNGKLTAMSSGKLIDMFAVVLQKEKAESINAEYARNFVLSAGRSTSSYSPLLKRAVEMGLLKKTGKSTKSAYQIVRKK